jgi:dynein heavy chain
MQAHPDFRLWLTSSPTPQFPVAILQNAVKMTMEPPTGLKANLLQTYESISSQELNQCAKPKEFKKLMFGLAYFHAIIQDRRKFGSVGWNIRYEFSNEDLDVCKRQLKIFLDTSEHVPYKVLNFLISEVNYGGRVTDWIDGRLMYAIITSYI